MTNSRYSTGAWGEDIAAAWLQQHGFSIVCRNWRKGSYELDLVCTHKDDLVFVEVKTRGLGSLESPREALSRAKQKSLIRAAKEYIKANNAWDLPCRFDLVCVERMETGYNLECVSNAFEFTGSFSNGNGHESSGRPAMDSGNTDWQPW